MKTKHILTIITVALILAVIGMIVDIEVSINEIKEMEEMIDSLQVKIEKENEVLSKLESIFDGRRSTPPPYTLPDDFTFIDLNDLEDESEDESSEAQTEETTGLAEENAAP